MKQLKKIISFIREILEIYIPMLLFFVMFCIFVAGIFFRYVIRQPLIWSNEAVSICFLMMVLLSTCYVQRIGGHVKFTMLFEAMPVRIQGAVSLIANLLLAFSFLYAFKPCTEYILFLNGVSTTPVFEIGLHIIYFPFIIFMGINIIYMFRDAYLGFMQMLGRNISKDAKPQSDSDDSASGQGGNL